jgi:putative methyltransferase
MRKNVYISQLGTGTTINLLPLAAGQLYASLNNAPDVMEQYELPEIIFRREAPDVIAAGLERVAVITFSCFLWNLNISVLTAGAVRAKFGGALIVLGGPAIPKTMEGVVEFFSQYLAVDVICTGEGEEVLLQLCRALHQGTPFADIPGIFFRDTATGVVHFSKPEVSPNLENLPSPYLDGTFDELYSKHRDQFSGICWETNRGCPYECTYCTWGNLPSHQMRMKPMDQVKAEIEWIGKNKINYIASADSNFGIMPRDVEIADLLAECKERYGFPNFISVSWAKHASQRVIKIGNILKKAGIGFRVTLSLQSLSKDVIKAIKRSNYSNDEFKAIKEDYHRNQFYSYTELILGLPLESYSSYLNGIENSLSESVYEQLYVYPLFLFPNTSIGSTESRELYGLQTRRVPNRYTKSKEITSVAEYVEIVVSTSTMRGDDWINSFVAGYYTLALHDDRLAFFILRYLKKVFDVSITDLIAFTKNHLNPSIFPVISNSLIRLENCAKSVQQNGMSHLIEPSGFDGIPFDPPDGVFLELLLEHESFYSEFQQIVELYLVEQDRLFDSTLISELFLFQKTVMAHPNGPLAEEVVLDYDWIDYFGFTFGKPESRLNKCPQVLKVIDTKPCHGKLTQFLKNHFDVRGVPPFNILMSKENTVLFPLS